MAKKVQDFWMNMESKFSEYSHCVYSVTDFDQITETPGLYSWHAIADQVNIDNYFKLFKQKRLNVDAKGNLKESYSGHIQNTFFEKDFQMPNVDFDLCQIASLAFCPPLYIGMSKNLNQRLKDHYSELEKIYTGKIELQESTELGPLDFDTAYESSHFAQRIGHIISGLNSIRLNSLFIKTIELGEDYESPELRKVEKYLNRSFVPIYGRR